VDIAATHLAIVEGKDQLDLVPVDGLLFDLGGHPSLRLVRLPGPRAHFIRIGHLASDTTLPLPPPQTAQMSAVSYQRWIRFPTTYLRGTKEEERIVLAPPAVAGQVNHYLVEG
jgi:hypothetical protein